VKATVLPSATVLCQSGRFTTVEGMSKGDDRVIGSTIEGVAMCFDEDGGMVIVDDHTVSRVSPGGEVTLLASGLNRPSGVVPTGRGSFLIIDGDGLLREVSDEGAAIALADVSGLAAGSPGLSCDSRSGNVLLAGGDIPKVSELAWRPPAYGEVLWTYGETLPGDGAGYLNGPRHAAYGEGLDSILVCDQGNDRIVVIDRAVSPQSVTVIDEVIVGTTSLPLHRPFRCAQSGSVLLVCEEEGEEELFSADADAHPALARAGLSSATGKDALPQYSGMKFVPIIRSVK
jgi:hypothetical protein